MQASSVCNAVTMTNVSSNVCSITFFSTLLVVSAKPYSSPKLISDSGKPSGKRKRGHSGSTSGLLCDEI